MDLYIRVKPDGWITYLNNPSDIRQFMLDFRLGSKVILGDVSFWSVSAINTILKFIEDNPQVDIYSSTDIMVAPILSRAIHVYKEPLVGIDEEVTPDKVTYTNVHSLRLSSIESLQLLQTPRYLRSLFMEL